MTTIQSVKNNVCELNIIRMMINIEKDNMTRDQLKKHIINTFNITNELCDELINMKSLFLDYLFDAISKNLEIGKNREELLSIYIGKIFPNSIVYYILKERDEDIEEDSKLDEQEEETEKNEEIDLKECVVNFKWRDNQIRAIEETIKQGFCSGIHHQIMGAGKTYMIMGLIQRHYDMKAKPFYYILMCDRQEVLRQIFFDEKGAIDKNKKKLYRDNKVIDLDKFDIIDCVNDKPKRIFSLDIIKPTIVVVNNAFLKARDYDSLDRNNTALIMLDECHAVSAKQTYDMLKILKYDKHIPIIGFSATPLRERAEMKLQDIFSKSFDNKDIKKLNIISIYDYMQSLRDDVILPFQIYCVEIDKKHKGDIKCEESVVKKIFDDISKKLPYKKPINWCGTIEKMKRWYNFFKREYPELDVYMSSCRDGELQGTYNCNYDAFCKSEKNSILLCVNRCREGVDIQHIDCGMYLDAVKNRSTLVCMQTAGRVLRPDREGNKKRAIIVNMFVSDNDSKMEVLTVKQIMDYYLQILNLTSDEIYDYKEHREMYKKMCELKQNTVITEEKNLITIKVDDNKRHDTKLYLKTRSVDWGAIKEYLEKEIDRKFNIGRDDKFKEVIQTINDSNEMDCESDFWKVYDDIKDELCLPTNFYNEYRDYFETKSWYELLGLDISCWYSSIKNIDKAIYGKYEGELTRRKYSELMKKDNKLPPYPQYLFKLHTFRDFVLELTRKGHERFV